MKQPDILIVSVLYNTYSETVRYLDSISGSAGAEIVLILVDNSNVEPPEEFTKRISEYPFLHYLKTTSNLGYFGGARAGISHFLTICPALPNWILVTNVDIVFTSGFFNTLLQKKPENSIGIIAPSIISMQWNTDYNPAMMKRYSKARLRFYLCLYSSFLLHNAFLAAAYLKKWISGKKNGKMSSGGEHRSGLMQIYAPHGSCIIFHRNYFERGGSLEIPNFLFGEEVHVAERAKNLGLTVVYHPELIIHDYEHASIGFFVTPAINMYYKESIRGILDYYYS